MNAVKSKVLIREKIWRRMDYTLVNSLEKLEHNLSSKVIGKIWSESRFEFILNTSYIHIHL